MLVSTHQIPGRKSSFKRERERQTGLDADGWSVSPNNSKRRKRNPGLSSSRQVINSLEQAERGAGRGGTCGSYCPGRAPRSLPPGLAPQELGRAGCAEACLGWKLLLLPASLKSRANSNVGKTETAHQRQLSQ